MTHLSHRTQQLPANHEFSGWREVIANTYFNLQLTFKDDKEFHGALDLWDFETVQLSRLESTGLQYRRLRQHCNTQDHQVLVTVPLESDVEFSQLGRTTCCSPGQYILELSEEPYEFGHRNHNAMWVLKIPADALRARIGDPSRFCARQYDARDGIGRLFHDYLSLFIRHCVEPHLGHVRAMMGTQLIDLLAVGLSHHPDAIQSQQSSVRAAHLARAENHIRRNLADPALSPQSIADSCGISLRYLHKLFGETGQSVAAWIRDLRLQAAHEALTRADRMTTVTQIAYAFGFADHSQFSHAYRRRYGHSPRDQLLAGRTKA